MLGTDLKLVDAFKERDNLVSDEHIKDIGLYSNNNQAIFVSKTAATTAKRINNVKRRHS